MDTRRGPLANLLLYGTLCAGATLMLVPLAWMILTSLKTFPEVLADPPQWLPHEPQWGNYRTAFGQFHFARFLVNSLLLSALNIAGTLVTCTMAAYAFSCLDFPWKNRVFALLLTAMMLPGQVTIIPLFKWYAQIGWVNTYLPLIVPSWLGHNIFSIFLIRQFFLTLPKDYVEAARLDGASEWTILWRIYVPLSAPVLLTVTVFAFLGSWNDLWGPLIFLHDEEKYTMSVGLLNFIATAGQAQGTPWHLVMAVSCVMMLPIVIVFFLAQRRFIEGIATSGLKG
jgi:ABC-type glycerol-3-phosphate transport system permease component